MELTIITCAMLYGFGILMRFNIGTSFSHRFQTKYKTYDFPHFLEIILFLSRSKRPIAFHSIAIQTVNIALITLMLTDVLNYMLALKIFIYFAVAVLLAQVVETLFGYFKYRGEHISADKRIKIDFDRDTYQLMFDKKYTDGYLDMYYRNRYKFFENRSLIYRKNAVLEQGTYQIIKDNNHLVFEFYKNN